MLRGLRQTIICSQCHETTRSFITYGEMEMTMRNEKSDCCNAAYEYIGLQPYHESILKEPIDFNEDIQNQPIGIINKNTEEENKMNEFETKNEVVNEVQENEVSSAQETQEVPVSETPVNEGPVNETPDQEEPVQETPVNEETQELEETPSQESSETPVKVAVQVTSASQLKIEDIIDTSKKMNKTVMFNALKTAMAEDNQEKVDLLKATYPDWFDGTLQYMPKKFMKRFGIETAK